MQSPVEIMPQNGVVFEKGIKMLNFSFVIPKQAHHCTELHLLTILHQNPYRYRSYVNKSMHEVVKRYLFACSGQNFAGWHHISQK